MSQEVIKFRPSNGTVGHAFWNDWCCKCQRDRSMREGCEIDECDDDEKCEILGKTMLYQVEDPEYPIEWQVKDGRAVCTAFIEAGKDVPRPRCQHTADLFDNPNGMVKGGAA